jgi:hypothetical protein
VATYDSQVRDGGILAGLDRKGLATRPADTAGFPGYLQEAVQPTAQVLTDHGPQVGDSLIQGRWGNLVLHDRCGRDSPLAVLGPLGLPQIDATLHPRGGGATDNASISRSSLQHSTSFARRVRVSYILPPRTGGNSARGHVSLPASVLKLTNKRCHHHGRPC